MAGRYEVAEGVGVIALDNPPVNGLGQALRAHIMESLDTARSADSVQAVVLIGAQRVFSAGADIREFNTPKSSAEPTLHQILSALEDFPKPVVAAVHGVAMGGGLELALACHYRVAAKGASIALPEVKLGLLPGAGGTQRLPRVIGVERAANMIVTGDAAKSEDLAALGLFSEIIEGNLSDGACAFARNVAAGGELPRVRDLTPEPAAAGFFDKMRSGLEKRWRGYPAPLACLACVEAAVTMPFDEGLAFERERFKTLMASSESQALRHAFFAERQVSKIPDVPADTPERPIKTAAILGCGTMGGGIAMNFANAGIPVTVLETEQAALDRGLGIIRKNYERSASRGRITDADVETCMGLITPTLSMQDIADADIVIEAVFEDMDVKKSVFEKLDGVMKPGAILATNTSTLDVDQIAAVTKRPEDVIGTHFFSPANVMRLLEIVRGEKTAKDVLQTTMKLARRINKIGVVSGVCDGFIGNRMLEPYIRQAILMVVEGAAPQEVDKALEEWGMAMGPFRMSDLAGNDVSFLVRQHRYKTKPQIKPFYVLPDRLVEKKRLGQKTGKGWYRYEPGDRTAHPDREVADLIDDVRREQGVNPRTISSEEIVQRCMYALANEGARLLEEGIAMRASDVDVIYLAGYGFPRYRGGPMHNIEVSGLAAVQKTMEGFGNNPSSDPDFWKPAPLIVKIAAEGGSL